MVTLHSAPPVAVGFAYPLRIRAAGETPAFPAGCAIVAEVRAFAGAAELAGTLSTAGGSLVRIDDDTIELRMPSAITAALGNDTVALDFVRVDVSPDVWLGIQITLPVVKTVTRPGPDA
jgi:hypothetical protein